MRTGYLHVPDTKRWAPYQYSEGVLVVYTANNLDIDHVVNVPKVSFQCNHKYLVGVETSSNNPIVFFVDDVPQGMPWSSSSCKVYFYFILDDENYWFSGISFYCKELDFFYDSVHTLSIDVQEPFRFLITTKNHKETVKSFDFMHDGVLVNGSVVVSCSYKPHSPTPLELKTTINLIFPETDDFEFIMNLYTVAYKFICFIAARKNVFFDVIKLHQKKVSIKTKEGYTKSISLCIDENNGFVEDKQALEKTLPYSLIENHLSTLWQFISDNKLYAEHLPENSKDSSYTIARMVLIMAAFEWNANEFLEITTTSVARTEVKNDILSTLESLSNSYNSKKKGYLKSFIKQIELYDISLSGKIKFALHKYENILFPSINYIYGINKEPLKSDYKKKIAERVQSHRNAFAHGDIQIEIDSNIILDLYVLQWTIYCIILEEIGFSNLEIKKAVHYFRNGNVHIVQSISEHYDNFQK